MKKVIVVGLTLVLMSSITFGSTLDSSYIDLIFNKFESYDDETKKERAELLDVFITSDVGLDVLCNQIIVEKKDSMEKYNISEESLKENIEALKNWSVEDRKELVTAGASGNKSSVVTLNEKYKTQTDTGGKETIAPTDGTTSTADGVDVTAIVPLAPISEEGEMVGPGPQSERGKLLLAKGYINKPIEPKKGLEGKGFEDIVGHWSSENVTFLAERGLINGNSEIEFSPDDNIKKSEIVAIICRMVIEDETKLAVVDTEWKDVKKDQWFYGVMNNAYALGLINKNSNEALEPNKYLTREEVVEILVNTINLLELPVKDEMKVYKGGYKDFDSVTKLRRESMAIALNIGIIQGDHELIAPQDAITRGEIATVVKRVYTYIQEQL